MAQGKCRAIVIVALLAAGLRPCVAQPPAPSGANAMLQAYPCATERMDATVSRLRSDFQNAPEVRIAADPRAAQILVFAPPEVQALIAQRFGSPAAAPPTDPTQIRLMAANPPSTPADPRAPKSATVALRNTAAQQFEETIVAALGKRLTSLPPAEPGVKSYQFILMGGATVRIDIQQQSNRATVQGSSAAVDSCVRLIQSLDVGRSTVENTTRLVSIPRGSTASVRKAVDAIQSGGSSRSQHGPMVARLFQQAGQQEAAPPAGGAPGQAPAPGAAPPAAPAQPAEKEGGGGLIGAVQIELLEGLDVLVVRGHKRDVDQVMEIIKQIESLSAETTPAIEVYQLKHVDCGAMADIVGPLYDDVFSLRQGYVSITPLMKPNAILFVGRAESVQTVIDLVKKLDKPVPPDTQFRVYRLQNAPALTAQQTVLDFYTGRGGLGPRVRPTADYRSNALIVQASPRDLVEIDALVKQLDTPTSAATNELRVFELENSLSDELAPILQAAITGQQMMGRPTTGAMGAPGAFGGAMGMPGVTGMPGATGAAGAMGFQKSTSLRFVTIDAKGKRLVNSGILTDVRIMSDARSNTLLVSAPAECMDLIEALVRQLDRLPAVEAKIKVFTIQNGDATALSFMLQDLFLRQVAPGQPGLPPTITHGESLLVPLRVSVDTRTNSIIAVGSVGDLEVAEAILLRLDDSDIRHRRSVVYRLKNAPADGVSNAINMFLQSERAVQMLQPGISAFEQIQREVVVVPEMVTNSLIVSATPRFFEEISRIVEQLDERPPMVMIQVLIAQLELDNTDEFGVELGLQDGVLFDRSALTNVITAPISTATYTPGFDFVGNPPGSNNPQNGEQGNVGAQGTSHFGLGRTNTNLGFGGLVLSASSENISVMLRALKECHKLEVLSRPQVMTLNNQPAYILVGQRVPRITGVSFTTFGQTNTTTLENVGLQVQVIPRISPDGLVVMAIDAEKSSVGPEAEGIPISVSNTGQVVRSPRYDTTVAQTVVSAASGQTVILGGLITKQKTELHRKVPWLGDIPVLGRAFRYDSLALQRTELLIIMTPHIVKNEGDAEAIRRLEADRMHWCLADVMAMHGGELRTRNDEWSDAETTVVYPDANPGGPEPVPAPRAATGPEIKQPPAAPPAAYPSPAPAPYPPATQPRLDEPPTEPGARSSGAGAAAGPALTGPQLPNQQTSQLSPQRYGATAAYPATYPPRYPSYTPAAAGAYGGSGAITPSTYSAPYGAPQQAPPPGQQPAASWPQYAQPPTVQPVDYRQYPATSPR